MILESPKTLADVSEAHTNNDQGSIKVLCGSHIVKCSVEMLGNFFKSVHTLLIKMSNKMGIEVYPGIPFNMNYWLCCLFFGWIHLVVHFLPLPIYTTVKKLAHIKYLLTFLFFPCSAVQKEKKLFTRLKFEGATDVQNQEKNPSFCVCVCVYPNNIFRRNISFLTNKNHVSLL